MGLFKTSGIVIKNINYGESDKILTILTRDKGKIQAIARGARKTKNRLLASTQLFCYSDFIIYQGKSMNHINQGELRESFYNLRMDLERLTNASYVLELLNSAIEEYEKEEKIFLLLIHTLKHMSYSKEMDINLITITFQIKLIALLGYAPQLKTCVSCGKNINHRFKMSPKLGGVIDPDCFSLDIYAMGCNQKEREALLFMLYQPLSKLEDIKVSYSTVKQLRKIMNTYVSIYLEKTYNSLSFLNIIESEDAINNK